MTHYKLRTVDTPEDATLRFILVEDRGERALFEDATPGMPWHDGRQIVPTEVLYWADVEPAAEETQR